MAWSTSAPASLQTLVVVFVSLNQGNGPFGSVNLTFNNFGTTQRRRVDGDKEGSSMIGFGGAGVWVAYDNGVGAVQAVGLFANDLTSGNGG